MLRLIRLRLHAINAKTQRFAGMTVPDAPILARFLDDLASAVLFGAALFPFWGVAAGNAAAQSPAPWLRRLLIVAAFFVAAAAAVAAANGESSRIGVLRVVLAAALLVLLLIPRPGPARNVVVMLGAFLLVAAIAWLGDKTGALAGAPVRAFHLVAAGVWIGALFVFARLAMAAKRRLPRPELQDLHYALERFSGVGSMAVAALIVSGLLLLGLPKSPNGYIELLVVKLAIFGGMLVLAAANRFWLTPRLSTALDTDVGLAQAVGALRISLVSEAILGTAVMAAAAWLKAL